MEGRYLGYAVAVSIALGGREGVGLAVILSTEVIRSDWSGFRSGKRDTYVGVLDRGAP